ncbi:hypothetical protein SUGI_0329400 [Cryptomeria japonica]|nr:hypothetical protein SUGI_0329400 [Cryptomeria japonica]
MGELGNLKVVEVENTAIASSPTSLEKHTFLKSLSLRGCLKLSCMPESIGQLKNLQYLILNTTGIQLLPQGLVHLSNLVELFVQRCVNLEEVKGLPITLVSLRLYLCDRLKKISGLSNLTKLRDLNLCGCLDLHELEDLSQLTSLESLCGHKDGSTGVFLTAQRHTNCSLS